MIEGSWVATFRHWLLHPLPSLFFNTSNTFQPSSFFADAVSHQFLSILLGTPTLIILDLDLMSFVFPASVCVQWQAAQVMHVNDFIYGSSLKFPGYLITLVLIRLPKSCIYCTKNTNNSLEKISQEYCKPATPLWAIPHFIFWLWFDCFA